MNSMHELPVTESIVRIVLEEAEKNKVRKIHEIRLKVGELSGLVPECIQYYYDIVSHGTRAEGARLRIDRLPVTMKCISCGFTGTTYAFEDNKCPCCRGLEIKLNSGSEFYIDSMEVDEDGD